MHPYLFPGLQLSPLAIRRILDRLPPEALDARPDPDRFSAREVIAHLADWEPIMRARVEAAALQPGSRIEAFDEGRMALEHGYAASDPRERMEAFARERAVTVERLRELTPDQWRGAAFHPERGAQTAEDLANTLLGHDLYHIEQLTVHLDSLAPDR